jgi:DNA-binding transcriptional ArsR family regulator
VNPDRTREGGGERMASPEEGAASSAVLAALGHLLRRRILRLMVESGPPRALSPKEIAEALGVPLPNVSYHVRVLAERGAVRLVEERPKRGSLQHFYVPAGAIEQDWVLAALGLSGRS